ENNRTKEAAEWFKYLCRQYPNKPLLDGQMNSMPGTLSLDDYAIGRVQDLVKSTLGQDDAEAVIEGMLNQYYAKLVEDQDAAAATYLAMAKALWAKHMNEEVPTGREVLKIPPVEETALKIRERLLDPEHGWRPEVRAALRSKLGLPPETKAVKES